MSTGYGILIKHDNFIIDALMDHCLVPIVTKKVNPNYTSFLIRRHRKAIRELICKYNAKTSRLRDSLLK